MTYFKEKMININRDTELRIVDSIEAFKNLREEWTLLYSHSEHSTIFTSWDWMFTWWEVFHQQLNTKLYIICMYQDSNLVGIAPFQIINDFPKSLIQGRTLCFIGSGEATQDKVVSQYMDFIVLPEMEAQLISEVSQYLSKNKNVWDFADFEFLLDGALVSQCFQSTGSKVKTSLCSYGNRFFISDLSSFDEHTSRMGSRWRKMLKTKKRKLEAAGEVSIETSSDTESVKKAFQLLKDMHEARWEGRTDINIFQSEYFNEFHLKLIERLTPQDKIKITTLKLNNEALATYYYFLDKNQLHYYQSGFYSENANRYSPLFLLVCSEIESSIENKWYFDFMFDENETSYKKVQYAAESVPMFRFMCSPYKSRFLRYTLAKGIQNLYLRLRGSLVESNCKGN